jgi:hypothetical protein
MAANGFLGAGDVYLNPIVQGMFTGWEGPFPADQFEIKADSDLKELISKGRNSYGQVDESVPVPKPFELSVSFTKFDKTGMSLAMMGTAAALSQASGSLANVDVVIKKDRWTPLSKANLSGPLVVKDAAGVVTYVEGTDYVVNKEMGWLYVLGTSVIADGATLKVSGAYLAITGSRVKGATQTSVRAAIRLNGINFADGLPVIVDVAEAVITSKAALDFLADNFGKIPLTGRMKTPTGATEPFTVDLRSA